MVLIRIGALFAILALFIACKTSKNVEDQREDGYQTNIKAIKFMGSINNYPRAVDETIFWNFPEEHAIFNIPDTYYFLDDFKELKRSDGKEFDLLTFAFIIKNGKNSDTIYADSRLNTFYTDTKGSTAYYDARESHLRESLIRLYSFFRECW